MAKKIPARHLCRRYHKEHDQGLRNVADVELDSKMNFTGPT